MQATTSKAADEGTIYDDLIIGTGMAGPAALALVASSCARPATPAVSSPTKDGQRSEKEDERPKRPDDSKLPIVAPPPAYGHKVVDENPGRSSNP